MLDEADDQVEQQLRLRIGFVLIAMVLSAFGARLVQLQGLDPNGYAAMAAAEGLKTVDLPAERGEILDRLAQRRALGISCHKAFVRNVPLTEAELRGYRAVFERLDPWDQTWTPFEQGANAGRAAALALLDDQLAGTPHADFVAVAGS